MTGGFETNGGAEERVEQQLAGYAFVREEREREMRLYFRDAPAAELARSFRASGASLITLTGRRAQPAPPAGMQEPLEGKPRKRRKATGVEPPPSPGELTVYYFYALGEIVYTVSIAVSSGVVQSVADIYPNAGMPERELQDHLGVVFIGTEHEVTG